jgi:hypothetical protein
VDGWMDRGGLGLVGGEAAAHAGEQASRRARCLARIGPNSSRREARSSRRELLPAGWSRSRRLPLPAWPHLCLCLVSGGRCPLLSSTDDDDTISRQRRPAILLLIISRMSATSSQPWANGVLLTPLVWLTSHESVVLFSQNKSAISNEAAVLFSQNQYQPPAKRTVCLSRQLIISTS